MKALVWTAPNVVDLQDLPVPDMKDDEVLVKIRAVGVCGSDLHGFLGHSKRRTAPLVLGHEFSGIVTEVGSAVEGFSVGDAVSVYPLITCGACDYCKSDRHHICPNRKVYGLDFHGALAEYVAAPAKCLFRIPEGVTFKEAALVEPLANAVHVLNLAGDLKGKSVAVFGGGSIGLMCFWLANQRGAKQVFIVDLNGKRLEVLKGIAEGVFVNASEVDSAQFILDATDGNGVDVSIDAVGNQDVRTNAVRSTCIGGLSIWVGLEEDSCEISGISLVTRETAIKGSYAYGLQDFGTALEMIHQHALPSDKFVTEESLDDGQNVFDELTSGSSSLMKAIFTFP